VRICKRALRVKAILSNSSIRGSLPRPRPR
jgi:hypothetical protein